MYGVLAGDLAGFPYEHKNVDLTDRSLPLFPETTVFSDKTVLTAATGKGLLDFERKLPGLFSGSNKDKSGTAKSMPAESGSDETAGGGKGRTGIPRNTFEETYKGTIEESLRRFGQLYPLAGYPIEVSIWLFREGAPLAEKEDSGPSARAIPVAWMFQEDLYMMRHLARLQAQATHRNAESVRAADAAACAAFLAIHGCTKDYIVQYLEKDFQFKTVSEAEMKRELLQAQDMGPALCVRAALTAFTNGRDFEDVLRRAVSLGGRSSEIAAVAGGVAEAFFGIPEEVREACRSRLPEDLRAAADEFAARMQQKKDLREKNPRAQAQWEQAMTRSSERHPAAVQGNEPLEQAIRVLREKKDQQSLINVLELLRLRMNQKGRLFVPLVSAKRAEVTATDQTPPNAVAYRMQAIRTKDGKLWQPAYTSREELDRANAAQGREAGTASGMVLSYAMDALLKRFLPGGTGTGSAEKGEAPANTGGTQKPASVPEQVWEQIPPEIEGLALNPYGSVMFLPRKTIEALFLVNRESGRIRKEEK